MFVLAIKRGSYNMVKAFMDCQNILLIFGYIHVLDFIASLQISFSRVMFTILDITICSRDHNL